MLYLNMRYMLELRKLLFDLTLTNVVFEFSALFFTSLVIKYLTLTNVVFE